MSEFTDQIRREIVPLLARRLLQAEKGIVGCQYFTTDYKAGVKDNLKCGVSFLNDILDERDEKEDA